MNDCQQHRGPDGEGIFTDGPCGLAHRRLSIIDVAHGQQPMDTADGRYSIAYNGEVYNYLDLRAELEALGPHLRDRLRHRGRAPGVRAVGPRRVRPLQRDVRPGRSGTAQEQRLTLARDHFGIKPLYVAPGARPPGGDGEVLLFSSEIKPILASGLYEKKVNERSVYRYLRFRAHEDGTETFFDGIERLAPGEMLTADANGIRRRMFTRLQGGAARARARSSGPTTTRPPREYQQPPRRVGAAAAAVGGAGRHVAVRRPRLQRRRGHHQPAAERGRRAVDPRGRRPGRTPSPPSSRARSTTRSATSTTSSRSARGHVDAHKILPTADEFKADLLDFVRTQEEPLISSGPYAQFQVMREATKHVTVLLDGQGADEMMAGYIPYYFVYLRQLRAQGASAAAAELRQEPRRALPPRPLQAQGQAQGCKKTIPTTQLLDRDFVAAHRGERYVSEGANLKKRLVEDLFHNSLPSLLRYEDKNTMRFSLEGRVPFLDKEVLKFIFSLSDEAIIKDGWNKRVLRDATRGLLPESINRRRNKIGFTTPQVEWFMRLKNHFYNIFLSESFANRPYVNQTEVLARVRGLDQGHQRRRHDDVLAPHQPRAVAARVLRRARRGCRGGRAPRGRARQDRLRAQRRAARSTS